MASGGSRKSPTRMALEKRERRALGGRLACSASVPSLAASASARRVVALRLASGGVSPRSATRSPARTSISATASVRTRARSRFSIWARWLRNAMEGDTSGQSQNVCEASHSRSRT